MEPSRLTQLPTDLIDLLAGRLDWRTLQETYQTEPALRQLDGNHHIWKNLYHRYLSPYELPKDGPSYRDQFFAGMSLIDEPLTVYQLIKLYTQLGYTVPLEPLYSTLPVSIILKLLDVAAEKGYLEIVKRLAVELRLKMSHYTSNSTVSSILKSPLYVAIRNQHQDVVEYLLSQLEELGVSDVAIRAARNNADIASGRSLKDYSESSTARSRSDMENFVSLAAETRNIPLMREIMSKMWVDRSVYAIALRGAIAGVGRRWPNGEIDLNADVQLMDVLLDKSGTLSGTLSGELYTYAARSRNPVAYQWLFDHMDISPAPTLDPVMVTDHLDLIRFIVDYTAQRWPKSLNGHLWDRWVEIVQDPAVMTYLINHPESQLSDSFEITYHLYTLAAKFNESPQLFEALYYGRKWPRVTISEVLGYLPPDMTLGDYQPALSTFIEILNSVSWTQDELLQILASTIGRGSRPHIDAILSLMKDVPTDKILETVDTVERNMDPYNRSNPYLSRVSEMAYNMVKIPVGGALDDIQYIRSQLNT